MYVTYKSLNLHVNPMVTNKVVTVLTTPPNNNRNNDNRNNGRPNDARNNDNRNNDNRNNDNRNLITMIVVTRKIKRWSITAPQSLLSTSMQKKKNRVKHRNEQYLQQKAEG